METPNFSTSSLRRTEIILVSAISDIRGTDFGRAGLVGAEKKFIPWLIEVKTDRTPEIHSLPRTRLN
jgi:hypothetical protein